DNFTVVAARGGDDVWVEIRRRKITDDDDVPDEFFASATGAAAPVSAVAPPGAAVSSQASADGRHEQLHSSNVEAEDQEIAIDLDTLDIPDASQLFESSSPSPAHEI